ncbi:MAG: phosphoenolpyruvate--protein phosphotransferase [Proteobacteria bacterium]|jgi:phosphoenolpyruvate-protein phosphotransferase|nr:phosphoenolpyruvate--protein phosphotransferase [Pseudomonadota bacterium]
MQKTTIQIFPPLLGVILNIKDVPDPVFAEKMVGDGIAIDPLSNHIYAPVSGTIKSVHKAKHAITVTSDDGIDVLIHIGLETVNLNGNGFKIKCDSGDKVQVGDILGHFDMDLLATSAKSLISPVVLVDLDSSSYSLENALEKFTKFGVPILTLHKIDKFKSASSTKLEERPLIKSEVIKITNAHGIHARPAAILSTQAREFDDDIFLEKDGKRANVKSVVALLGLNINCGDTIYIYASHQKIIAEIATLLNNMVDAEVSSNDSTIEPNSSYRSSETGVIDGKKYYGISASIGLAIGKLIKQSNIHFDFKEEATDIRLEEEQLLFAIEKVKNDIESKLSEMHKSSSSKALTGILSAHLGLLTDPHILSETLKVIKQNKTSSYAISKVIEQECRVLENTKNKLLIERQTDLRDVGNRILTAINGKEIQSLELNSPSIIIANELTPTDMLSLNEHVVGLVSVRGGTTSHVAILAKMRGIPLLIGVDESLLTENTLTDVILDTKKGYLNLSPTIKEVNTITDIMLTEKLKHEADKNNALNKAITTDGVVINCLGNIGSVEDAVTLKDNGAEGVGLFRTEFIFLDKSKEPTIAQQNIVYQEILNYIEPQNPFILRTLDAGGEKQIAYLNMPHEINPVLGMRGLRLCLEHREIFINQLTAILNLDKPNIKIMLPMVTTIEEYRTAKGIVDDLIKKLNIKSTIELGIMVEVPSVALLSDVFAAEVAFFSIGTNDLSQYTLAIDREHSRLASHIDHLHPAVLRNIDLVVKGAAIHNRPVSVCGLMASESLALPVLIGLGINTLSMNINSIPENKALIRKLSYANCKEIAQKCLGMATSLEVRKLLLSLYRS